MHSSTPPPKKKETNANISEVSTMDYFKITMCTCILHVLEFYKFQALLNHRACSCYYKPTLIAKILQKLAVLSTKNTTFGEGS
jgi:hypothetical protein